MPTGFYRFAALVAALVLALAMPRPLAADPADIAAAARSVARVVLIGGYGDQVGLIGHGSGVAIAPDVILTNAHVIGPVAQDDTVRVGVVPPEGSGGSFARVLAVSPANDLALLKLERGTLPAAALFTGAVGDGSAVFAVGYPGNVDQAQGLDIADIMEPTAPVKTQGTVSGGRSSKAFETILHTASIGAGNSGGPLVDGCGRVIGINSFGTLSGDGDSEFYFAVSMREISRFLTGAGIKPRTTGAPCRSLADLDRAEAQRRAGQDARDAEAARDSALRQTLTAGQAQRAAQFEIIAERENQAALAMVALVLALGAAGAWVRMGDKGRTRDARIAAAIGAALVLGALVAWLTRPSFADIDERAARLAEGPQAGAKEEGQAKREVAGDLVCVLDPDRSRLTVSDGEDVRFTWRKDGCVNGATQYGQSGGEWLRVLGPSGDQAVSVVRFDPAAGTWSNDRYLLDAGALATFRSARVGTKPPACGAAPGAIADFGSAQSALAASLPQAPNERLVYRCTRAAGASD